MRSGDMTTILGLLFDYIHNLMTAFVRAFNVRNYIYQ